MQLFGCMYQPYFANKLATAQTIKIQMKLRFELKIFLILKRAVLKGAWQLFFATLKGFLSLKPTLNSFFNKLIKLNQIFDSCSIFQRLCPCMRYFDILNLYIHLSEKDTCILFVQKSPGLMFTLKMSIFVSTQVLIFLKMSLTLKDSQKAVTY